MRPTNRRHAALVSLRTLLVGLVLLCAHPARSFVVTDSAPLSGPPGTVVTVTGMEFATSPGYTVTIDGSPVAAGNITGTSFTFTIPSGATSGEMEITDGTTTVTLAKPFKVTRIVPGTLALPSGLSGTGWTASAGDAFVDVGGTGDFTVEVGVDEPTMVWLFRNSNEPSFMTLVVPSDNSATVNAATTAAALVYLVPVVGSQPTAPAAAAKWAEVLALEDLPDLTGLINETSAAGSDYLQDIRVENTRVALVQQVMAPPPTPQDFKDTTPQGARLLDLFPDQNPNPIFHFDPVLESKIDANFSNRRHFLFSFNNLRDPSLDYIIDIYELDPAQFPNGFDSVEALEGDGTYSFLNDTPWASGFVRAKLSGDKLDYFGALYAAVLAAVTSPLEDAAGLKPNVFEIPTNHDAVYAAHAHSGNIWYGLDSSSWGQAPVINEVDPNHQWTRALAGNLVIASIDLSSLVIDVKKLTGSDDAATIHSIVTSVYKSMLVYRADDGISADEVYDLIKSIASSIVKTYVTSKATDQSLLATAKRLGDRIAGTIASSLNVLKKIGTGLNVAERTFNLVSSKNLALERSVFVIGDPFEPNILRIEPRSGRTNAEVLIFGNNLYRFPEEGEEDVLPVVELCTFQTSATDPDNAPIDARLRAKVIEARPNRLRIQVTNDWTGWQATFNTNKAFICITRPDSGNNGDSRPLFEEGKFEYIPPPEILGVEPTPIVARSHFTINGAHFTPDCQVLIDNIFPLAILQLRTNRLQVALPNLNPGTHELTVKCGDVSSLPFPIEIGAPTRTPSSQPGGVTVTVTQLNMSNTADGEISLLEAFLIANGGLGRPIEIHHPCEDILEGQPGYCGGFQQRETDFVSGDDALGVGGGPNVSDTIIIQESLRGGVANISQALPKLSSNDEVQFKDITIDGSGAPANAVLLSFDNTLDASVRDLVITNWPGDAIQIVNDSHGNRLDDITIANATGDGLFISNGSTNNLVIDFAIDFVGGTGVHVEGDSHGNSFSRVIINFPGKHGVHLETRCRLNAFNDVVIQGAGMDGFRIEDQSDNNGLSAIGIATSTGTGLRISGSSYNRMYSPPGGLEDFDALYHPRSTVIDGQSWGIVLENGAANNVLSASVVGQNASGGIFIHGAGTRENVFGRPYRQDPSHEDPIFTMIADNMGPGVRIADGARRNSIVCVNVAGNNGDGIQIDGEDTDDNRIQSVLTGYRFFIADSDPQPAPNLGNSITISGGADLNQVTRYLFARNGVDTSDDHFRNSLFLDTGNGIEIRGDATQNVIDSTTIGNTFNVRTHFGGQVVMSPVGQNGIVLTNGPNRTLIGSSSLKRDVHVDAVPEAAVLLVGEGTDNNTILGLSIGDSEIFYDYGNNPAGRCQTGIHLKDGPKGNQIGLPGPMDGREQFGFGDGLVHEMNRVNFTKGAGILLENCGGSVDGDGDRVDPNVLQNNDLFGNEIGLMLLNGAVVNDIGGPKRFNPPSAFFLFDQYYRIHENTINGSRTAGILIRNNVVPDEAHRNRLMNNTVSSGVALDFPNSPVDPAIAPPSGTAILVDGSSTGNFIGENFGPLRNIVRQSPVGVYLNGVSGVTVRGILFDGFNFSFPHRVVAGVVVRNGAHNRIGGDTPGTRNQISNWNNANATEDCGIYLFSGMNNILINNDIFSNGEHGIVVSNSVANLIGDGPGRPNQITDNGGNGILLTGPFTTGNLVSGNLIGTDGQTALGNTFDGIRIENGASENLIGVSRGTVINGRATTIPGQNVIAHNGANGIRTAGATSTGNTITHNSIHDNTLDGILNASGGNRELPPPINVSYGGNSVSGSVANLVSTPPGSVVQVFSDSADQGEVMLGEATVTPGGAWTVASLGPAPFPRINVNITSAADGSSSEFTSVSVTRAFSLARTDGTAPSPQTIAFAGVPKAVLPLRATAVGSPVLVDRLVFTADGTLIDDTEISEVAVYLDADRSGTITPADYQIGVGATYDADNGTATVNLEGAVVDEDQVQEWLVAYTPAGTIPEGRTFSVRVENISAVNAEYQFPIGLAATPAGTFPIRSDDFTVGQSVPHPVDAWRAIHFPGQLDNPLISGYGADPDGDKIANLFEYLLGTDPNVSDADDGITFRIENDRFVVEIERRTDAAGVDLSAEATETLTTWLAGLPWLEASPTATDLGNGFERVTFRTAGGIASFDALMVRLKLAIIPP